ncbi:hypothetical protein BGP84_06520 [Pseudomonas putida]|uniref:Uncharacterized protein n=2 Tax=Pseudomonas putida TaxID=303 RepID=A0A2S3X1E0_PSEPU|nr:hypothetical protein [Pseudomonas putida]POG09400.1 hypothetical protein BGP84_06520 [Pseudomonas putida]POG15544.1 hypothetical protein BGP85_05005 [Pseudomonas putida]
MQAPDRITLVLRACEAAPLSNILPFAKPGQLASAGRGLARIVSVSEGDLQGKLAEAHTLLRDAQASHGSLLMTDPPQDPWKTRRISERIAAALSGSSEPGGVPTEQDERARFEAAMQLINPNEDFEQKDAGQYVGFYLECAWIGWRARAALERQP